MQFILTFILLLTPLASLAQEVCLSRECLKSPDKITLDGLERSYKGVTALGPVEMRWSREAESILGRQPERLLADAATAMARILGTADLGVTPRNIEGPLNIVMLSRTMKSSEVPLYLLTNCHPGWMVPPNKIYLSPDRVAEGCGSSKGSPLQDVQRRLRDVFIHELAHVVEFNLTGGKSFHDRQRGEGFATWLELKAAKMAGNSRSEEEFKEYAEKAGAGSFDGSIFHYAREGFFFSFLEKRYGIHRVRDIYRNIRERNIAFPAAVNTVLPVSYQDARKEFDKWIR